MTRSAFRPIRPLLVLVVSCFLAAAYADEEKPNRVERGLNNAGKGIEKAAKKTGKALERAAKATERGAKRTVERTENFVKKQTE